MRPKRIEPGPGQESVWDYPRPPRLEKCDMHVQVIFNGVVVADTRRAYRVLETSQPPTYYIPAEDVRADRLEPSGRSSFCEWKGRASYHALVVGDRRSADAAWSYPEPSPAFAAIRGHLAFYPSRVDACTVAGEAVRAQAGDFYGGWITGAIVGPFKGEPGTSGW
ncbi:MAG TPA: DUF427 domain-containing protein [Isosphaeraceae bacterium]|jgi:uncharacterized protein (DUF427 family)|nr:DUF427 domain-containing protein [Isosphaeraceae bacterium]